MSEETPNPYQAPVTVEEEVMVSNPLLDGRLRSVAFGLKLIFWGMLLILVTWVGMIPISLFMFSAQGVQWLFAGIVLIAFGMVNIGPLLCLTAPKGYGLRRWAIATVSAQVLVILAFLLQAFSIGLPVISGISIFLLFAGMIFLGFMHRLAKVIGRNDLVLRCRIVFLIGVLFVLLAAGFIVFTLELDAGFNASMFMPLVLLVILLVLVVFFASVANSIANAIRKPPRNQMNPGIAS